VLDLAYLALGIGSFVIFALYARALTRL